MGDYAFATLSELRAALRRRQVSSVELTRLALSRLETIGLEYNAVARILGDRALREAQAVDRARRSGHPLGPLAGLPYGAKDLLAVRGVPTTWGAPPYARQVFDYDAAVVELLRDAGAVLVAKLAMIELAGGGGYRYPAASLQGPAKNPWNPGHWSGGSSSGTGVAVGAGLTPFGIGSETSGSILSPSAYCGVTGLRPTYGLVSRWGAMALCWSLDKLGPMCRSAEDCGLVLEAMAGPDARDPSSAGRRFRFDRKRATVSGLRLGYLAGSFEQGVPPSARPALRGALAAFRRLTGRSKPVALPRLPIDSMARIVIRAEGSAVFEPLVRSPRLRELADRRQAIGLRAGLRVPAVDYLNAMRLRRLLQDAFARLFADVDVILAPSRPGPAPRLEDPLDPEWRPPGKGRAPSRPGGRAKPGLGGTLVQAGNLAGLPALSVPCGFSTTHLPLAVQIVGPPFSENRLIALGRAYQEITDWHRRIPPIPFRDGPVR